jgi:hypothetical protein
MGIEEMFRDCKSGGYNLEGTGLRGNRLNSTIVVVTDSKRSQNRTISGNPTIADITK